MALIKCRECGKEISDKAPSCPGCGAPLRPSTVSQTVYTKKPTSIVTWMVTGIIGLSVLSCVAKQFKEHPATSASSTSKVSEVDRCIGRGIKHFQEIDSYPRLKSEPNVGRLAYDVASERCNRTTTAF